MASCFCAKQNAKCFAELTSQAVSEGALPETQDLRDTEWAYSKLSARPWHSLGLRVFLTIELVVLPTPLAPFLLRQGFKGGLHLRSFCLGLPTIGIYRHESYPDPLALEDALKTSVKLCLFKNRLS